MRRLEILARLFVLLVPFSRMTPPSLSAADPAYEFKLKDQKFKKFLDEGLDYFVKEKNYAEIAELIHEVVKNEKLRRNIVSLQKKRLADFEFSAISNRFLEFIRGC